MRDGSHLKASQEENLFFVENILKIKIIFLEPLLSIMSISSKFVEPLLMNKN